MTTRAEEHARKRALRKQLFKTKTGEEEKSWRQRKDEKKRRKEDIMIKEAENFWKSKVEHEYGEFAASGSGAKVRKTDRGKPYTLSIAIPGSFLLNAQSAELRTYMAGQIARAATLFRVSEVIVYDESARMTDEQLDVYWGGHWHGDVQPAEGNIEANFHLARILEYLECPQYLRKALFLKQRPLQYAGLLNPLDSQHHLKAFDLKLRFREGVILDKPVKRGRGPLVDIGLDKELELEEETPLPAGTRITVEMGPPETDGARRYRGRITSAKRATAATGQYWGYSVRIAKRIGEVIDHDKYDCIIGTSPNGSRAAELEVDTMKHSNILVVFGGIDGVDAAIEGDEAYDKTSAEDAFTLLLRPFVANGSRSERIEENVLAGLSTVDSRVADLYGYAQ